MDAIADRFADLPYRRPGVAQERRGDPHPVLGDRLQDGAAEQLAVLAGQRAGLPARRLHRGAGGELGIEEVLLEVGEHRSQARRQPLAVLAQAGLDLGGRVPERGLKASVAHFSSLKI